MPSIVEKRQEPLRELYRADPASALIRDRAATRLDDPEDPFHGLLMPGSQDYGVVWPFSIHAAVGGDHDGPNPGDLLAAALASCLDSTIRIIASRLRIELAELAVEVSGDVDVRGTLLVDRATPVGFQCMHCRVRIVTARSTPDAIVRKLIAAAEHSCVNLQTLRAGVPVTTTIQLTDDTAAPAAEAEGGR